jgi:hypothetical protein
MRNVRMCRFHLSVQGNWIRIVDQNKRLADLEPLRVLPQLRFLRVAGQDM